MNIHYSEMVGHKDVREDWDFYAGRHTILPYASEVTYPHGGRIHYAGRILVQSKLSKQSNVSAP